MISSIKIAASAGEVVTLSDIMYMQDMTTAICNNSALHETRQLMDTRDFKVYWVAKLKDNNCWMTQNLDYDDPDSARYSTPSEENSVAGLWPQTNDDYARYYDPGDYYYVDPESWKPCTSQDGLAGCTDTNWLLADGDNHYHVGNYYNQYATRNGICPTGWHLPGNVYEGSTLLGRNYTILLKAYNVSASSSDSLRKDPLYFVPGGSVYNRNLVLAGSTGSYWTSAYRNGATAYSLTFTEGAWDAEDHNDTMPNFFKGQSVRCLAF